MTMKLYSRLLRQDPKTLYPSDLAWVHDLLNDVQHFDIDNIARYYFSETDQEDWRPSRDLPNLAPPYPRMWFEYAMPKTVQTESYGMIDISENSGRNGILIHATDLNSGEKTPVPIAKIKPGTRWILVICGYSLVTRLSGEKVEQVNAHRLLALLHVDGAGRTIVEQSPKGDLVDFACSYQAPIDDADRISFWGSTVPALLAISLLHCKNVVVESSDPPAVQKHRDRHGTQQRYTEKTLHVIPMRRITKHEASADSGDKSGSRFHHKRGHFKTYTDDAPLFGRWTGSWWWSDQTVGDLSLGSVEKTYKVDTLDK